MPRELELASATSDGVIMGVRHRDCVVEGVQFHPESIMTEVGYDVLSNFLGYSQPRWPQE
jgi:anthranilate/para-aminobenzoate synthase component II